MPRLDPKPTGWRKGMALLREETAGIHPRLLALNALTRALPRHHASHARARLFALAGFSIGEGTHFADTPKLNGGGKLFENLIIGKDCAIEVDCVFDLEDRITIGDRVTLSPGVMILTSTHKLDFREHRAGAVELAPVNVGAGVWLGARCTILPGVTIGEGAIVNAGSVVNKNVAPNVRVGGIPAAQLEVLQVRGQEPETESP